MKLVDANHKVQWENAYVDEAEVGPHFESVDAVVLPYRHIDQSGVLFTAFRFGCPIIGTDVGSFASTYQTLPGGR